MTTPSQIRFITAEETYFIRRKILRDNDPNAEVRFEGDTNDGSFHLGFFYGENLQGIVTVIDCPERNVYQIRGMAVLEECRGKRIGECLIKYLEYYLKGKEAKQIWMNARLSAVKFYEKLGYDCQGNSFEIPSVGRHILMRKWDNLG